MKKILFVCLGNICRSPTAHGVLLKKAELAGLKDQIEVDSCGTGSWHIGQPPDERTVEAAEARGYDLSELRARRLNASDYKNFDYILAMDTRNLADVIKNAPSDYSGKIKLFLDYAPHFNMTEVPDPYYGGQDGFERVLELIEAACDGLLDEIKQQA
jgi:protein-tyrosine phosphatase